MNWHIFRPVNQKSAELLSKQEKRNRYFGVYFFALPAIAPSP
jgi:hypothetical protein